MEGDPRELEPRDREHGLRQLGGQTPLSLARDLERAGARILGTSTDAIDRAENRERFRALIERLGLSQPRSLAAGSVTDALRMAEEIGYPVLIRPSYVLGGRGMRILYDRPSLVEFLAAGVKISPEEPLLIDSFLEDAIELDVDAVADGTDVLIGGILEHIEEAGVHSGDSACVTPPYSIGEDLRETLVRVTRAIAVELGVRGLLNIQFAVKSGQVFVLEVNPRASRTVPFVSKATGVPLARIAAKVIAGRTLKELGATETTVPARISVKRVVLPFDRFPGEDTLLGPEMKSTGEVMGIDQDFGRAFAKAHLSARERLPLSGNVFLSVSDSDKRAIVFLTKQLVEMGFRIFATKGTSRFLQMNGIRTETLGKVNEGIHPNAVDRIREGKIDLVINTPLGRTSKRDDRWIRRAALDRGIVCVTTIAGASAAVSAIEALRRGSLDVASLQEVYATAAEERRAG
jgi:carbamoyl-phosphate synthase large subunit